MRQYRHNRFNRRPYRMNEAVDGGWVVENSEAQDAYQFACERFGTEQLNQDIVDCLGTEQLASCLAFIFRMNDFREWEEYKEEMSREDEYGEEYDEYDDEYDDDVVNEGLFGRRRGFGRRRW